MAADFKALKQDLTRRMDGAMETLRKEFAGLRTGRASPALLEPIRVDAYGSMTPLNQVANISVAGPGLLSVQVWDKALTKHVESAIREANQIGTLQPTTLVAYRGDLDPVFDATDANALQDYGLSLAELAADDWRIRMRDAGKAPTQLLAERLIADGHVGMQVRSFAKGATSTDLNMVLWKWAKLRRPG